MHCFPRIWFNPSPLVYLKFLLFQGKYQAALWNSSYCNSNHCFALHFPCWLFRHLQFAPHPEKVKRTVEIIKYCNVTKNTRRWSLEIFKWRVGAFLLPGEDKVRDSPSWTFSFRISSSFLLNTCKSSHGSGMSPPPTPGSGSLVLHCNQAAVSTDLLASWERSHYSQLDSKWPKLPVRGSGTRGVPHPFGEAPGIRIPQVGAWVCRLFWFLSFLPLWPGIPGWEILFSVLCLQHTSQPWRKDTSPSVEMCSLNTHLKGEKKQHFFPQMSPSGRKGKSHQHAESFSAVKVLPCARAGRGGWKTVSTLSLTVACQVIPMPPVIWAQTSVSYQCFTNPTGLCIKGRKASRSGHFLGVFLVLWRWPGSRKMLIKCLHFSCECVLC